MAPKKSGRAPLIRSVREVDMKAKLLEDISLAHQDALEADQKSPRTLRYYRQRQEATMRDFEQLLGRAPTLADWLDVEVQRRRYRLLAERERSGHWRRATTCGQYRSDAAWESFMVREGLIDEAARIMGRLIRRPKDTTPQKTPVTVDILKQIPRHYDEDRYEQLSDLVRIYALVDTLVRADELCAITIEEYDRRTGTVRINNPKGGGSRAVQLSRYTQRLINRYLDLRAARAKQRRDALLPGDPLFATIHDKQLTYGGLKETMRRLSRKLGRPVHAHLLRHTGAVRLLVNGMPQITLQHVLGHTTLEMTRRYVKLSEEETLSAHRSYAVMDNLSRPAKGRGR